MGKTLITDISQVDPRWIDVDFTKEKQYVRGDNGMPLCFGADRIWEQRFGTIPSSLWEEEIRKTEEAKAWLYNYITRIYNQKSEGSCVSNATGQSHEIVQGKQYGRENVIPLSAISLYKRCGRSPGSGSMLSENLDEMQTTGILPLDTPENRAKFGAHVMDNTGYYTNYPSGWTSTAAKFKIIESWIIRSIEGLVSALLAGFPVVVGRAGHSIVYVAAQMKSGSIVCPYVNSWGDWGYALGFMDTGFGLDSVSYVRSSAQWAFAVRVVTAPQQYSLAA